MTKRETFSPGVWITDDHSNRRLVTPTGFEWTLAFAMAGCQWAIDALPEVIERMNAIETAKWTGEGI